MLGEDDRANVEGRLQNGWRFVGVSAHPTIHRVVLSNLLEEPSAMVLMQRPTADVQAQFAHEHAERTKLLEDAKAKLIADGIAVSITNGEKTT